MWAFLVIDRVRRVVFGARDRMGIKSLYRCSVKVEGQAQWLLASEIKSIRASGLYEDRVNLARTADYLGDGRLDDTDETMFAGIDHVPAGHAFEISPQGEYRQWRYWNPEAFLEAPQADAAERFAALFEDAMALHMRSDVPVAVHLSGGMDSTSIACAAARLRAAARATGPLLAFSYFDPEFDEQQYIDATLRETGATPIVLPSDAQRVWRDLPAVLAAQDEPMHSLTPVVGWQLMQMTAQHGVKVVLNGQGADETLGGYRNYFRDGWVSELVNHGPLAAWREIGRYANAQGQPARGLFADVIKRAVQGSLRRHFSTYRMAALRRYRGQHSAHRWLASDVLQHLSGTAEGPSRGLRHSLIHSMAHDPLPLFLRLEDRNSMAHSIEGRVPFLDHRLVELGLSLERQWKLDANLNKVVLRQAMQGRIPDVVSQRVQKMGFPTPNVRWLRHELRDAVAADIAAMGGDVLEVLKPQALQDMLGQHAAGQADHSLVILRAFQWARWRQGLKV